MSTVLDVVLSGGPAILWPQPWSRRPSSPRWSPSPWRPLLTPLAARFARRIGAVDQQKDIGLAKDATPLLGGLAIFGGALVAGLLFLPDNERTEGILAAAALITIVGALDDVFDLPPIDQARRPVRRRRACSSSSGVVVDAFTFPFVHRVELGEFGGPLTMFALVLLMNIVNFSDGVGRAGRGRVRDRGGRVRDHRLRPRSAAPPASWPRSPRAPRSASCLQLPAGLDLHGRLRVRTCSGCCSAR